MSFHLYDDILTTHKKWHKYRTHNILYIEIMLLEKLFFFNDSLTLFFCSKSQQADRDDQ